MPPRDMAISPTFRKPMEIATPVCGLIRNDIWLYNKAGRVTTTGFSFYSLSPTRESAASSATRIKSGCNCIIEAGTLGVTGPQKES